MSVSRAEKYGAFCVVDLRFTKYVDKYEDQEFSFRDIGEMALVIPITGQKEFRCISWRFDYLETEGMWKTDEDYVNLLNEDLDVYSNIEEDKNYFNVPTYKMGGILRKVYDKFSFSEKKCFVTCGPLNEKELKRVLDSRLNSGLRVVYDLGTYKTFIKNVKYSNKIKPMFCTEKDHPLFEKNEIVCSKKSKFDCPLYKCIKIANIMIYFGFPNKN